MKNHEQAPQINTEDERNRIAQRERNEWGKTIAKKFGIEYIGEFFVIPQFDADGKEIKRTHVHAWDKIPFWDGEKIEESVGIESVIEAIQKYPDEDLRRAATRIEKEKINQRGEGAQKNNSKKSA